MRSLLLTKPGDFIYQEMPHPGRPHRDEVLVKIHRIGICGTDFHAYRGLQPYFTYPRRLGHELGVEVLEVGPDVKNLKPGDKCAVEPYLHCGTCHACRRGKTNCCEQLKVLGVHTDGGFCDFIILPLHKLHVANDLDYNQLALVETLGIGFHAVNRADLVAGQVILVNGAGPIGLTIMQAAKLRGVKVIAHDNSSFRLGISKAMGLAEEIVQGPVENMDAAIRQLNGGELPEVVFDATGHLGSMQKCFDQVAFGGIVVFVGLVQDNITFPDPFFHRKEITLMGSRNATSKEFKEILQHLQRKTISLEKWIGPQISFEGVISAFPRLLTEQASFVKAIINLDKP